MALSSEFLASRSRLEKWALELAALDDEQVAAVLAAMPAAAKRQALYDWRLLGRPQQQLPEGPWRFWVIFPGRGWGKTKTGTNVVKAWADSGAPGTNRIALVGPTAADVRDVMVLGETGLLAAYPTRDPPVFRTSPRRSHFPTTGAQAFLNARVQPDRLRGPQHGKALADEIAGWAPNLVSETWRQLMLGLRLGTHPQAVVTTTPKPIPLIKDFVAQGAQPGSGVIVTRGSTYDNVFHLPDSYLEEVTKAFGGTRFGRQELFGDVLEPAGGLFKAEWILRAHAAPEMSRVVVGVDPAITTNNDETGIVVVGRAGDRAYVLEDLSGMWTPDQWGQKVVEAAKRWRAARVVAETNAGGLLVEQVIRNHDQSIVVKPAKARIGAGKGTRAEPTAALYEQKRVFHVGKLERLEEQMTTWDPTGSDELAKRSKKSPDRMDALVWAMSDLGFHLGLIDDSGRIERVPSRR